MSNAIAISRDLVASGLTQKQADTIAEVVVTHADDSHATKADIVRVEGRLDNHSFLLKTILGGIVVIILALVTPKLTQPAPIAQPTAAATATTTPTSQ